MNIEKRKQRKQPANIGQKSNPRQPDWWESLPPGERKLICSLLRMLRTAKQSQLKDVARAAAEWERSLGCFIKVRLMNGYSKRRFRRKHIRVTVEASKPQNN